MVRFPTRGAAALMIACAAVALPGCTKLRSHQGYVIDPDLVNAVQPGIDTRQSVLQTLGTPTFTGQFSDREWFYLSRDSRNFAFNRPRAADQTTLKITFDQRGNVTAIDRTGVDQVVGISPSDKKTPTLGRESNFFSDLFGNIGTVGAPGTAGPSQRPN
ncbi:MULTISPECIES: outer membrane protein assembly factor BamE [unclassified Sphingomonas]|uniref:outer membrane protein assembly factor BamE n=1 Tax=unclassified Sphingomonas TaxID=196159 RepID=UPI0007018CAA|nr:cell envelope protein SmpA [Sphingomonas sp. Leaf25]KQN35773.1 cell envelope protein SmpA [Sphingomonas sp. Leaf42]KQT26641.1 cell envelope protein SmpA [Sphingomonas sp. Leaf407]